MYTGHKRLGWVMTLTFFLLIGFGMASFVAKKVLKWDTKTLKNLKSTHRNIAFVFWTASYFAIYGGMYNFMRNYISYTFYQKWNWLVDASLNSSIYLVLLLEAIYQLTKYLEDDFGVNKIKTIITLDEFESRIVDGEKLVILEDMILDISTFAYAHPGGAFLLEHNIGSDVTKFFYGAYALDQNSNAMGDSNTHVHSNIARKIAIKHVIGILKKPFQKSILPN
jgi:hypothetical protein